VLLKAAIRIVHGELFYRSRKTLAKLRYSVDATVFRRQTISVAMSAVEEFEAVSDIVERAGAAV
jgi:hypothetical protein